MENKDAIIQMLRDLEAHNIKSTNKFYRDITALIDVNLYKFVKNFSIAMKSFEFNAYSKIEKLNISLKDRKRLNRK